MTREDIVRIAQEAAIMPPNWGATENQWRSLEEFARLVAEHEREACAKVCEQMEADSEGTDCCKWPTPIDCAEAIRAKGNT